MLFIANLGDMAAETIDFAVVACNSGGTGDTTITGKAVTQLAANASANDNKQLVIAVDEADLIASGLEYVQAKITTGGATGGLASIVTLGTHFNGPASGVDASSVVQIVP